MLSHVASTLLLEILEAGAQGAFPVLREFERGHSVDELRALNDEIFAKDLTSFVSRSQPPRLRVNLEGLALLVDIGAGKAISDAIVADGERLLEAARTAYLRDGGEVKRWSAGELADLSAEEIADPELAMAFLLEMPIWASGDWNPATGLGLEGQLTSSVRMVASFADELKRRVQSRREEIGRREARKKLAEMERTAPQAPAATRRVFYAWQSDLPNASNRGLISGALELALGKLSSDPGAALDPAPDRDTKGVPGSPDISSTIFQKIDAAAVFVADISIVTPPGAEPAPNPNVLIELGYALRALGPTRVVCVVNEHFGRVEQLPFDLRGRRALRYANDPGVPERADARKKLAALLEEAVAESLREAAAAITAGIRVELSRLVELGTPDGDVVSVSVQNHGDRPLFISSISFEWQPNDGMWTERDVMGRTNSGGKVEPGDAYPWIVPVRVLKQSEASRGQALEAVAVHDRLGNIHRSTPGELRRVLASSS